MKSNSSLLPRAAQTLRRLTLAVLGSSALLAQAANPTLTGTSSSISINDEQTSTLYASATVTEAATTNIVEVDIDFWPTNVGGFLSLPSGVTLDASGTNLTIVTTNDATATTLMQQLTFTPMANVIKVPTSSNVVFHAQVLDAAGNTSTLRTTTLSITATNNAPTFTVSGTFNITDKQTNTQPFQNVFISDVDDRGLQTNFITVTLANTNSGYFTVGASGFSSNLVGSTFVYRYTNIIAQITNAVKNLTFIPTENFLPVGQTDTNLFTLRVSDKYAVVTNASVRVLVYSTNDFPTVSDVPTNDLPVVTGQSAAPFAQTTLIDVDQNDDTNNNNGQDLSWSITLTGSAPLGQFMSAGNLVGTSYGGTGDPVVATALLRGLTYVAPNQTIAGTNRLTVALAANDGHGGTLATNLHLKLYSIVLPPGLSGTQPGQTVYDNTTLAPFSKVGIQSFNGNSVTLRIQLGNGATNDALGQFINLGSFAKTTAPGAPSLYQFTGTSEAATTAIKSLLFQPTANRIIGASDLAVFGLQLIDGNITNNADYSTTVTIVPVNDLPAIAGVSPLVTIADNQTNLPFANLLVTDADESGQQPLSVLVTLDLAAKGGFSTNSLLAATFTNTGSGYVYYGTPAQVTTAIRKLVFVPTPGRVAVGLFEITTFTVLLNDGKPGGIVQNNNTALRVSSVSGTPVFSLPQPQPVSIPLATNLHPFESVSVSDANTLRLLVRINSTAQGFFTTNSVTSSGFTNRGGGNYFITGAASNVTAALQLLVFTPATNLPFGAVINFTLTATNSLNAFAAANHAMILRTLRNSYIVTKLTDYDPAAPYNATTAGGTLRQAVAAAKSGDHITFDIRSYVPGVPDYPAVIRLTSPLILNNDVTFDGPGAERLAISGDNDQNGTPDVQLFTVNAKVTMNRLTFTQGTADFAGGAFEVSLFGDLKLSYCAVTDCKAVFWGGGIDVDGGRLNVDHSLIRGNSTSAIGEGGGGVSLYTDIACTFLDTTFATNRQSGSGSANGGGALYAETINSGNEFDVLVLNCTFRDNVDTAGHGSSIRPNVFNTFVKLQNTIVADGHGKNIEMDQSGAVISLGGNISDDSTATIFSAGGNPLNTFIFHAPADYTNVATASIAFALANNGGPTATFALKNGSAAIDNSISNFVGAAYFTTLGTDQRGFFRTNSPDIGAFELNASQRLIIEEIGFNPATGTNDQFIEFYVPRDSAPLDVSNFVVKVDGVTRHTFASTNLQPGQALVLFGSAASGAALGGVPSQVGQASASGPLGLSSEGGTITVLNPSGQTVFETTYVGAFACSDTSDYGGLAAANQSVVLSPQFAGVFLPYLRGVLKDGGTATNLLSHAGYDTSGQPNKALALGNAPPAAFADDTATDAHTPILAVTVLDNDVDADITDTIRVVAIAPTNAAPGFSTTTAFSTLGALITINNSPTNGASISYDPTASAYLTALPQGSNVVDTFQYVILDYSNSIPNSRGSTVNEIAVNVAAATAKVAITVLGVNSAPTPQADNVNTSARLTTREDAVLDFTTATNILANDTDPNSDDNSTTLNIVAINATNGYLANNYSLTTALGATVTLDIRFDRNETHLIYNPTNSATLNALGFGQTADDTFSYTVTDRYGVVGTTNITIRVTGVNDAPVAQADVLATDEDTAITNSFAYFLANDSDVDTGTSLSISSVTPFSLYGASVTLVGTNLIYNPAVSTNLNRLAQKEIAYDTFTYTLTDTNGLTSNAVVTVTVSGVNDAPISAPDFYTNSEDTLFTQSSLGVLANDIEPDINGLTPDDSFRVIPFANFNTVTNAYTSTNGGAPVTMNADGSFTFDPRVAFDWIKQGEVALDSFRYVVMDHSLSIANDDNFAAVATTTNNILPVLANDVVLSAAGGAFTITSVATPNQGGSAALNASSNAIVYTPLAGYVGAETFTYTVADGLGGTDKATVTMTMAASALYANNDSFAVAKGTTNVLNLLANDLLIPASVANISITSLGAPSAGGTVSLNGVGPNNSVNYTPNATNAAPSETFSYVITSGTLTATGSVYVALIDRATVLTANNDHFTVIAGSGNTSFDLLVNDTILPTITSNLFITSFTTNNVSGVVSLNTAHTRLVYRPNSAATNITETIDYDFADGAGGTGHGQVAIDVVTNGFFANPDYFTVAKNSSNTLPVMVNDVILPNLNPPLYISGIGIGTNAPSHGTVTINGSQSGLIYKPTTNYNGSDDFTYEITDGSPLRALGHVHVEILDTSKARSNPDTFRVARESTNNILLVIANDYTLPKTPGSYTITALQTPGIHATVTVSGTNGNNPLLYSPNARFIGVDHFSYEFTDTLGNRGTNAVTVTVGDLAPLDDAFNVISGSSANVLDVRANDYAFPDTNALRVIASIGATDHGGTAVTNGGATAILYSPAPGFVGVEHFNYQLNDDSGNAFSANVAVTVRRLGSDRDTNIVTMTVVGVNDLPTIVGAQNHFHITDKMTVQPFTNIVIGDRDEFGYQTNILTVSLDNAVKGTLTNLGGFVNISPGVYQMQDSPPAITASLKSLVFVPTENRIIVPTSETTRFTIVANDSYVLTLISNSVTTVIVDSVNDAPVISGTQGGFQINDKQTVQPFTNVVITEVDDSTLQSLIVRVSLDNAAKGLLQNLGGFTNAGGGAYVMQGIAANITASLKTLRFVPTENRITVPTTETTTFTISVNDSFTAAPVTNNATTVFVTATNDPATIFGGQGGFAINDKQTVSPFTNVVIADVDDLTIQPLFVTVALDVAAKGVLQNLGGFTNSAPGIYTMLSTATNVSASLRNLVFRPTENRITVPTAELTTLTIFVDDGFQSPLITNALTTITVTATNDAPTIVGTATNSITDKQTTLPFATVTFGDVDNLAAVPPNPQPLTVRIVMDNLDKGGLQNLGGFTVVSNGVFQLTGFAPTVTANIRGIVLVPVENHITVPTTSQIHFAISADDGFMALPTTNRAAVNVTAVNDAPTIAGTVAGQTVYNRATIKPFSGVLITELDNDRLQVLRTTITLDSASKGFLSSLGGFTDLGGGVYSLGSSNGVVTAATITTAIRGLVFNPTTASRVSPGAPETTRFTIRVDDFFAATVVDSNTTVIAIDPLVAKVTASDRTNAAQFGWSVATLRDLSVVGAPHDTTTNAGAAYLYARSLDGSNTWTQIKKFVAPDARANDEFGTAVAISEETIVVGARLVDIGSSNDVGAAYVYSRNQNGSNQWGFVKKLFASDGRTFDEFGTSVAVSNTLIVVGAPLADVGPLADAGKVYLFERDQNGANQWGQVKRLVATNSIPEDHFGAAVSLNGDTLAVGSPLADVGAFGDVGAVFIFGRNQNGAGQWGQVKKLTVTNAVVSDRFGSALSISGDTLAVGAPLVDVGAFGDAGAAYLYSRNLTGADQWGLVKKFTLTNALAADHFGAALAINEDSLVISAPQVDGPGTNDYGVAYLFQQNQGGSNLWGQVDKWQPAAVSGLDNFGSAVAISRGTVVIGAYNGLDNGARYGTAFMYRISYNNAPQNLLAVPNQSVTVGVPFTFALPAGAFVDPDFSDTLADVLGYSLGSSPAVPAWLNFDPVTGIFTGTPTAAGSFPVNLVATDLYGASATVQFIITSVNTNAANFNLLSAGKSAPGANQVLNLRLTGNAGVTYRLQQATNLTGAVWVEVASQTADGNGVINLNVTNPPTPAFYRTVWP